MSPMLEQIRVLELGGRGAAVCGRLFAQLGADVLVVHPPDHGDSDRSSIGENLALSANKRHTVIDPSNAAGKSALDGLLRDADMV